MTSSNYGVWEMSPEEHRELLGEETYNYLRPWESRRKPFIVMPNGGPGVEPGTIVLGPHGASHHDMVDSFPEGASAGQVVYAGGPGSPPVDIHMLDRHPDPTEIINTVAQHVGLANEQEPDWQIDQRTAAATKTCSICGAQFDARRPFPYCINCSRKTSAAAESPYEIRPADEGWFSHDSGTFIPRFDSKGNDTLQTEHGQGDGRVAYFNNEPVASVTWQQTPQGYMIGSAYTHPDHRGQGLFNQMTQELRDSGQPVDAYHWDNPWLKNKVRDWRTASKTAGGDWFCPSYEVPDPVKEQLHQWAQSLPWPEGSRLKDPSQYHITSFYSPSGWSNPAHHQWLAQQPAVQFPVQANGLDMFGSPDQNGQSPVVMRFHAPELSAHAEQLMDQAQQRGLEPARFEGHKAHVTVGHATEMPQGQAPNLSFQTDPMVELHNYYDSLKATSSATNLTSQPDSDWDFALHTRARMSKLTQPAISANDSLTPWEFPLNREQQDIWQADPEDAEEVNEHGDFRVNDHWYDASDGDLLPNRYAHYYTEAEIDRYSREKSEIMPVDIWTATGHYENGQRIGGSDRPNLDTDLSENWANVDPLTNDKWGRIAAAEYSPEQFEPYCDDQECYLVAEQIANEHPELPQDAGFYNHPTDGMGDHSWNRAADGTIIDATHSQFGDPRVMIAKPGTPEHERYVSFSHNEQQAQAAAHSLGHHDGMERDYAHVCPQCASTQPRQSSNLSIPLTSRDASASTPSEHSPSSRTHSELHPSSPHNPSPTSLANTHRPVKCNDCDRPLSVKEKRSSLLCVQCNARWGASKVGGSDKGGSFEKGSIGFPDRNERPSPQKLNSKGSLSDGSGREGSLRISGWGDLDEIGPRDVQQMYDLDNYDQTPPRPDVLYHAAPISERESIRQQGLAHNPPWRAWGENTSGPGVFLADSADTAHSWASPHKGQYDIWSVNGRDLPLDLDRGGSGSWVQWDQDISPDRLQLVAPGPHRQGRYEDSPYVRTLHSAEDPVQRWISQGEVKPFAQHDPAAQKAIAHYMGYDGGAWDMPYDETIGEMGDQQLANYVKRYADQPFGITHVPAEEMKQAIMTHNPDIRGDHSDWDSYHQWYNTNPEPGRGPPQDYTEHWPVILDNAYGNILQDGWHRLHRYVDDGVDPIPAVFFPPRQARVGAYDPFAVENPGPLPCPQCGSDMDFSHDQSARYDDGYAHCPRCRKNIRINADEPIHQMLYREKVVPQNLDQAAQPWGDWLEPNYGKTASRSQREWAALEARADDKYGPSQSETLHEWPDGWQIRQHQRLEDVQRMGMMMANCWQSPYWARPDKREYYTLHDPMGRPKIALDGQDGQLGMPMMAFNTFPWDSSTGNGYLRRMNEWALQNGYDSYNGSSLTGAPWSRDIASGQQGFQSTANWHLADYQGWTNWDTWHTKLMMDNEYELYKMQEQMMDRGWSPEQIRDWAVKNVIGPYNKQQIADAQDWNEIPEHDRLDHHYEEFKDKHGDNPAAMNLIHGLGGGPDVSDEDPTLIDPEMVNWPEIHENIWSERGGVPQEQQNPDAPGSETFPAHWSANTRAILQKFNVDPVHPGNDMPFIYAPEHNTVFVGPHGAYHWQLINRVPELEGAYDLNRAWQGAPASKGPDQHIHGRLDPRNAICNFTGTPPIEAQRTVTDALNCQPPDEPDFSLATRGAASNGVEVVDGQQQNYANDNQDPTGSIHARSLAGNARVGALRAVNSKKDPFYTFFNVPDETAETIADWAADDLVWPDGAEREAISDYHITFLSCEKDDADFREWVQKEKLSGISFKAKKLDYFQGRSGGDGGVVLVLESKEFDDAWKRFKDEAAERSLEPVIFDGKQIPHVTIAYSPERVLGPPPELSFEVGTLQLQDSA